MFVNVCLLLLCACLVQRAAAKAEDVCLADGFLLPESGEGLPGNDIRCCTQYPIEKGDFAGKTVAQCDTSSCVENFGAKNLNCFNYGSPENPVLPGEPSTKKGGSNNCPYTQADQAICAVDYYLDENVGNGDFVNCRLVSGANHCLGKVKCGTEGVDIPSTGMPNHHSDGTTETGYFDGSPCPNSGEMSGRDCFYDGASENWKVCDTEPEKKPCDKHYCGYYGEVYGEYGHCYCKCHHGYSGEYCEHEPEKKTCDEHYCGSYGEVYGEYGHCYCKCHHGYSGKYCEHKPERKTCDEHYCGSYGEAYGEYGHCYCKCHHGYSGEYCEHEPACYHHEDCGACMECSAGQCQDKRCDYGYVCNPDQGYLRGKYVAGECVKETKHAVKELLKGKKAAKGKHKHHKKH